MEVEVCSNSFGQASRSALHSGMSTKQTNLNEHGAKRKETPRSLACTVRGLGASLPFQNEVHVLQTTEPGPEGIQHIQPDPQGPSEDKQPEQKKPVGEKGSPPEKTRRS